MLQTQSHHRRQESLKNVLAKKEKTMVRINQNVSILLINVAVFSDLLKTDCQVDKKENPVIITYQKANLKKK